MNQDVPLLGYRDEEAPAAAARTRDLRSSPRPRFSLGIAAKLAAWTAAIGLAAIASITFYMYSGSADAIVAREQAAMSATLDAVDVRLNARLAAARGDVLFLAKTPALGAPGSADGASAQVDAGLADLFSAMLVSRPRYVDIRYVPAAAATRRDTIRVERGGSGEILRPAAEASRTVADQSLLVEAARLAEGEVYTSEMIPAGGAGAVLDRPVVAVATPTYAGTGELTGAIVIDLDATQLFDLFDEQFKQAASQYFAAEDGRYLQPPDITKVLGFAELPRYRLQDDLPELAGMFAGGQGDFAGVARLPAESYLAAAHRIHFDPRLPARFLVVAELQSEAGLLANITNLRNTTALTATGWLLVGFLAVIWLARLIVKPLRQMTVLASQVAAGDRTVDLGRLTRRGDEAGELARAFAAMLHEVKSRELELASQAEELQRSNHELSHFAYVASHDLQEPLRMVASYLQLLRRRYQGKLDAEADEFIGYAVDGAGRMKGLINDVLGYARVSNAALMLQSLDLEAVASRIAGALAGRMAESQAELIVGPLPAVRGDPSTIERLFTNLVDNALKYRSPLPPRIELASVRAGEFWEISVADNGIGIAPEFREKVFEIFTRLHSREKYEGTGIGLAACRRIVERHGGRIWVDAAPAGGSIFRFTLPALSVPRRK